MYIFHRIRLFFFKIVHYEYWPFWLFYLPMYFYGLVLALRAGSLSYFTAANPVMKYGGAFDMLKFEILERIDPAFVPRGILVLQGEGEDLTLGGLVDLGLPFPLVAKPNKGERGKNVELLEDMEALVKYFQTHPIDIILQEYIQLPLELGILYYRFPDGSGEEITSVVIRDFLKVEGDGQKNLMELINEKIRALNRRNYLYRKHRNRLTQIPATGESILLEPIGNHCRGTKFLNGNHIINPSLVKVISGIVRSIDGFDYGRFDLKAESIEALYKGEGFKILELNGVNSEPAHIYDPDYTLFSAYRDIARHMGIIFRISRQNHRNGLPYAPFCQLALDLRNHLFPVSN